MAQLLLLSVVLAELGDDLGFVHGIPGLCHLETTCAIWSSISTWGQWPAMNPAKWKSSCDLTGWFFDQDGKCTNPEASLVSKNFHVVK